MKSNSPPKEIAFKDDTISRENLPYPIVLYPGFYGAFFAFKADHNSEILLCECSKEAIENYIRFRTSVPIFPNSNPYRMYILDSMYYPTSFIKHLIQKQIKNPSEIINNIHFERDICHECNLAVPHYAYCHEMYGGAFKQNFGWYINKKAFEFGVEPISNKLLNGITPNYILEIMKLDPEKAIKEYEILQNTDPEQARLLHKKLLNQNRELWNFIENEVRIKFGHKKVGEAWTSETVLYSIIRSMYPTKTIMRHYKPEFLKGLELDIFIEDFQIGIEYQGIQHFQPVQHWGGKNAFDKLKERDKLKKELCLLNNITLIYFNYNEGLTVENIQSKLKHHSC